MATDRRKNACVVVLGDLCRSPRIRNQALSLAEEGVHVRLVGYDGGSPPTDHERIRPVYMTPFPGWVSGKLPKVLGYALKALWQALTLLCSLLQSPWSRDAPDLLLLQNPPSIPSLAVCHVYCTYIRLGRCKFVIDWHNYGYSIMALQHGGSSPLVRLARWMERNFGKSAAANFSVTEAMKRDLEENWGVRGVVTLYDRAPEQFKPLSKRERTDFLKKMKANHGDFFEKMDDCGFVISSTSWTEDEDFSILLHALEEYEAAREKSPSTLPPLRCAITGKGPLKEYYRSQLDLKSWRHVRVILPWLEAEDYPRLLACADLGVSLHTSSSGLDLPMKAVDMLGAGTPVAAVGFRALPELVRHGENGLVFSDREELAGQLVDWFSGFPDARQERAEEYAEGLERFGAVRWKRYWKDTAWPVVKEVCDF